MPMRILPFILILIALFACVDKKVESPEVEERKAFAKSLDDDSTFRHVGYRVDGKDSDTLRIDVTDEVAPFAVQGTVEMLVTSDLKGNAKKLGFVQIHVKGGTRTLTEPDTINRTISLR